MNWLYVSWRVMETVTLLAFCFYLSRGNVPIAGIFLGQAIYAAIKANHEGKP